MRVLREQDGWEIALKGPPLGRAGGASVYAVPDQPDLAARIYHNPTPEHAGKLTAMLAAPPVLRAGNGHVPIAWPVARLLEAGAERRVVGYLMPRTEQAPSLWEVYNPGARLQVYPQFHYGSLLRTARNLAGVVAALHQSGYVIGDLNESNVVVTPRALATLIDVDLLQVPGGGRVYRCRVGRPEYTPPELQGVPVAEVDRQPEHDAFALAVLIFRLLMQGVHPFASSSGESGEQDPIPARIAAGYWPYAWERPGPYFPSPHAPPWTVLPPAVQELLRCCFEDAREDPGLRPGAVRWRQALEQAENDLTTCPQNAQHRYARGLDVCPWCALARQQGRDPFPAAEVRGQRSEVRGQRSQVNSSTSDLPPLTPGAEVPREDPGLAVPPTAAVAAPGRVEAGLRKVGTLVQRHGWVAWLGAILVGTVAGMLWALEHAAEPGTQHQTPPVTADRGEEEPATSPSVPLLPPTLTVKNGPPAPPPAPVASRPPEAGPAPPKPPPAPPPAPVKSGPPEEPVSPSPEPSVAGADEDLRKIRLELATREYQQASDAYSNAIRVFQATVGRRVRGEGSQEDVLRAQQTLQGAQRRYQAAGQALQAAKISR
jgi:serine/threonine protein kinase